MTDETPPKAAEPHELVSERLDRLFAGADPHGDATAFLGRQFDLGLAWVHFPVGAGGLGLDRSAQAVVEHRLRTAGAPSAANRNVIGYGMAAPTLVAHGSAAQRDAYLRPLFTGEEIWCQLFSEPGAGSDLASLATRATLDGDVWRLTGQKVWTSYAHRAQWGLLLARTHPVAPKHRGLTYFVVDMRAPGIDVRPLVQMTGDAEFNEVYLTDVAVPDSRRLGAAGDGWRVAMTTLMNERVAIGAQQQPRGYGLIGEAVGAWLDRGRDDAARDRLMELWIEAEALRLATVRFHQRHEPGQAPGPDGSIAKLFAAELNQRIAAFTLELQGADGMLKPDGYPRRRSDDAATPGPGMPWGNPAHTFLRSRANSIEGGTSEVMRNILGERVLGLPADLRVDKDLPWLEVRRS